MSNSMVFPHYTNSMVFPYYSKSIVWFFRTIQNSIVWFFRTVGGYIVSHIKGTFSDFKMIRVFRGAECNSSYREIKFGFKDMRGKITKGVYYRAIKELIEYSFVKIVNKGSSNKVQFGENRVNIENEKMVKKTTVYDLLREGKNAQ